MPAKEIYRKYSSELKRTAVMLAVSGALILLTAFLTSPLAAIVKGPKDMTVECGDPFEDPGCVYLLGLGKGKVSGRVDTGKTGDYVLSYGILNVEVKRTVHVVDTRRPEIKLKGTGSISAEKGTAYEELGYTAWDIADGDLTDKVYTESDLDMSTPGVYHISYYVTDAAGNATRERRTVTVTEKGPMTQSMTEFDLDPFFPDVICKEVPFDEEKYESTVIFGDSFVGYMVDYGIGLTDNMWSRGAYAADEVYSKTLKVGQTESGKTFFELMDEYRPPCVIILLGNHTSWLWPVSYYRSVFDGLFAECRNRYPETVFAVCSLPPYDEGEDYAYLYERGFLRNQRINEANTVFCELCRKYGMKFINAAEILKDPANGYCRAEYMGPDKFHLSTEGFEAMLGYIRTHMDY